jgi:hypothetical protein
LKIKKKYIRVDRKEICFLKFIFEAYDGIATLTTVDKDLGIVLIIIAPGCEKDVEMILHDLKKDILIEQTSMGIYEKIK